MSNLLSNPKAIKVTKEQLNELSSCFRGFTMAKEGNYAVTLPMELATWVTKSQRNIMTVVANINKSYENITRQINDIHKVYEGAAKSVLDANGNKTDRKEMTPDGKFWVLENEEKQTEYMDAINELNIEEQLAKWEEDNKEVEVLLYPIDRKVINKLKGATIIGYDQTQNQNPISPDYSIIYDLLAV